MRKALCTGVRILFIGISLLLILFGILGIRDHLWHLLVIGILVLGVSIFWNVFASSSIGKIVRSVLVGFLLILALIDLGLIIAGAIISQSDISTDKKMTMLILGTDTKGDQPGDLLLPRLDTAIEYLGNFPDTKVIVSGKGRGEYSEAEVMMKYLVAHGIDPARIFLEDHAQSTRENLIFSQELALEENLSDRFLVVTNNYHQFRASIYAKDYGIVTEALSAPTTWYLLFPLSERERYLIVTEWLNLSPDLITKFQEL